MARKVIERGVVTASLEQQLEQTRSLHRQAISAKRAELLKKQSELLATVYIRADDSGIAAETKRLANVLADLKANGGPTQTEAESKAGTGIGKDLTDVPSVTSG